MRTYLADGVYAEFDGYSVALTTEDGYRTTNTIVLDAEVMRAFEAFLTALMKSGEAGAAKRAFDAAVGRGEGPPALSIVRPVTDCGVLGCDQLACKGDVFNHRREIDDFGNLLPEASR